MQVGKPLVASATCQPPQCRVCLQKDSVLPRDLLFHISVLSTMYATGRGMAQLVEHVAFDLKLGGSIPAIVLRNHCWVRLPHSSLSCAILPGVQGKVGCPPTSSVSPS